MALTSVVCPDCGGAKFYDGPSGGLCQNVECVGCGTRFNNTPVGLQRLDLAKLTPDDYAPSDPVYPGPKHPSPSKQGTSGKGPYRKPSKPPKPVKPPPPKSIWPLRIGRILLLPAYPIMCAIFAAYVVGAALPLALWLGPDFDFDNLFYDAGHIAFKPLWHLNHLQEQRVKQWKEFKERLLWYNDGARGCPRYDDYSQKVCGDPVQPGHDYCDLCEEELYGE